MRCIYNNSFLRLLSFFFGLYLYSFSCFGTALSCVGNFFVPLSASGLRPNHFPQGGILATDETEHAIVRTIIGLLNDPLDGEVFREFFENSMGGWPRIQNRIGNHRIFAIWKELDTYFDFRKEFIPRIQKELLRHPNNINALAAMTNGGSISIRNAYNYFIYMIFKSESGARNYERQKERERDPTRMGVFEASLPRRRVAFDSNAILRLGHFGKRAREGESINDLSFDFLERNLLKQLGLIEYVMLPAIPFEIGSDFPIYFRGRHFRSAFSEEAESIETETFGQYAEEIARQRQEVVQLMNRNPESLWTNFSGQKMHEGVTNDDHVVAQALLSGTDTLITEDREIINSLVLNPRHEVVARSVVVRDVGAYFVIYRVKIPDFRDPTKIHNLEIMDLGRRFNLHPSRFIQGSLSAHDHLREIYVRETSNPAP
ncbi:MAG: hypothetical protein COV44_08045 [Deltaproteobacteria bacterium CG11_big_fil_rev_8_21_14_0_20_45_16]|nr:MAG: hypothetical protein COV44_08045 [Deltaproteobacteria bacterium CG11_big_fil_rev_8_21_14_0_20_45_16]